jgi:hypothetical protein
MAILIIETNNPSAIQEAMFAAGATYITISYGATIDEAVEVHNDNSWQIEEPEENEPEMRYPE